MMLRLPAALGWGVLAIVAWGSKTGQSQAGWLAAVLWLSVMWLQPHRIEVNHRWLSVAFFLAALVLLEQQDWAKAKGSWPSFLAGILLGFSVWTTPSYFLAAVAISVIALRTLPGAFTGIAEGMILASLCCAIPLGWQGALGGFGDSLIWVADNFVQANRYSYGRFPVSVPPAALLPAYWGAVLVPVGLLAGLSWCWRREPWAIRGVLSLLVLLAAAYPKWDAYSLQFLSAPATGLTVLSIHRYPVLLSRLVLQIAVLLIFGYSVLYLGIPAQNEQDSWVKAKIVPG